MNTFLTMGRIGRPHGIKGWVRIISLTTPPDNIFHYKPWFIKEQTKIHQPIEHKWVGQHHIAKLTHCDDRETATHLTHTLIQIQRHQLPILPEGEYYCSDLKSLRVLNENGDIIGQVDHLFATGSNDVIVITSQAGRHYYTLPYINDAIIDVDLTQKSLTVHSQFLIKHSSH